MATFAYRPSVTRSRAVEAVRPALCMMTGAAMFDELKEATFPSYETRGNAVQNWLHRIPHHKHDIAYRRHSAGVPELLHDLAGREVSLEAHGPRGAEGAPHLAADLGGHAQGRALLTRTACGRAVIQVLRGSCVVRSASEHAETPVKF